MAIIKPTKLLTTTIKLDVEAIHKTLVISMSPGLETHVLTKFSMIDTGGESILHLKAQFLRDLYELVEEIAKGPFIDEALDRLKKSRDEKGGSGLADE
jgi:hypothetical protein